MPTNPSPAPSGPDALSLREQVATELSNRARWCERIEGGKICLDRGAPITRWCRDCLLQRASSLLSAPPVAPAELPTTWLSKACQCRWDPNCPRHAAPANCPRCGMGDFEIKTTTCANHWHRDVAPPELERVCKCGHVESLHNNEGFSENVAVTGTCGAECECTQFRYSSALTAAPKVAPAPDRID